ncbi:MAG: recombinase family protein, partial [Nitrospirae bacterium]|nr:recombinase family protein [Nitrospirota bacterium]
MNQRHIPAPGATYRRKRPSRHYGTWSASVLHGDLQQATGMLSNPVYIGRVIWNRREWLMNPETKRRVPRLRPESDWIITEQLDLRIIPQPLWDRVQQRRKSQSQQTQLGEDQNTYYEERCLAALRDELLTPDAVERIIQKVNRLLAGRQRERQLELERLHRQLATVEDEIANIMKAIKAGILTASTKQALEQAEAERAKLLAGIAMPTTKADKMALLLPRIAERYRTIV